MVIASGIQFHVYLPMGQHPFTIYHSVLNVKSLVVAFNHEKALLVEAFPLIVKTSCETDGSCAAVF